MGFGHRVYKTGDPRARILKAYCTRIAAEIGDDRWERIAEPIERAVTAQKKLPAERRLAERPALSLHGSRTSTSTRRSSPWPASPAGRPTSSSSSTTTA